MTTLEEDIKSFRNIIKCLKKYNSVGDKDPTEDFGYDSDDEGSFPYNHYPELISCVTYNWNCIEEPKSCEEINDEKLEIEDCNIFLHLTESRKPDKNGNPYFQSMKFWGGCMIFPILLSNGIPN